MVSSKHYQMSSLIYSIFEEPQNSLITSYFNPGSRYRQATATIMPQLLGKAIGPTGYGLMGGLNTATRFIHD